MEYAQNLLANFVQVACFRKKNKRMAKTILLFLAEARGFEPLSPWRLHDFQSCSLWPLRYASISILVLSYRLVPVILAFARGVRKFYLLGWGPLRYASILYSRFNFLCPLYSLSLVAFASFPCSAEDHFAFALANIRQRRNNFLIKQYVSQIAYIF